MITKHIKIESFSEIEIDGVFDVILNQGSKESVSIESDENLVDLIDIKVSDKKLMVALKKDASIGDYTKLNIFINYIFKCKFLNVLYIV